MTVNLLRNAFRCVICASEIDRTAQKCLKCETWQNWKRFVPASQLTIALLLSLISVTSAVVPPALGYLTNRSHTYVRILGEGELKTDADAYPQKAILLLVANNGRRPSIVKSASISFENINAAPTDLEIHEAEKKLVLPEQQLLFHLTADQIARTSAPAGIAASPVYATITVTVEETDIRGNLFDAKPAHRVAATTIADWMDRYVPSQ